jgi:hypothetical protein
MRIATALSAIAIGLLLSYEARACDVAPVISAPPNVPATIAYPVLWLDPTPTTSYELQEAASADFANAVTIVASGLSTTVPAHPSLTAEVRLFYRVRELCGSQTGPYSTPVSTLITPMPAATSSEFSIVIPDVVEGAVTFDYLVPGFGETANTADVFSITTGSDVVTVFPPSGALSAGGTTIQFTIAAAQLPVGAHRMRIIVGRTQPSGAATPLEVPLTVTIVPQIQPLARSTAPPDGTLLIPTVAHADGLNSRFQSDVRITNGSESATDYELTYTQTGVNGNVGRRSSFSIAANETKAFDDLVKLAFGAGVLGDFGLGTLEVRPTNPVHASTIASSRTYNVTPDGTLGQYIPALPLSSFIGSNAADPLGRIFLQQLAASARYRTNLGFAEASGEPVSLMVRLYDADANLLGEAPFALGAFGHRQLNLTDASLFPGRTFDDGRVEVEVVSQTGRVTAYASVLDNQTSDPLLVFPVQALRVSSMRYVLPGVAELNTARNFHTDMRIFNPSLLPVEVTLSYRPQSGDATAAPQPVVRTIGPRRVEVIDNALPTLWSLTGTGGAISVTTTSATPLVITGRTYSRNESGGTYGQFIPAITPADAVGLNERSIEVMQLEQSQFFRSNLGLVEVSGSDSVTIELRAYRDGETTPVNTSTTTLTAGEFRQISSYFAGIGASPAFNGRVSIRVTGGAGRISAYGSVIDSRTEDPTYIPAQ